MAKCKLCREREAEWAWQPFGPDEEVASFSFLGSHYRGFPVIKVCDPCKQDIERTLAVGGSIVFSYKNKLYRATADDVKVEE